MVFGKKEIDRQQIDKTVDRWQIDNDKENMIKCQQLENMGEWYMGVFRTSNFSISYILFFIDLRQRGEKY